MPLGPTTKTVQDVIDRVKRQFGDESGAQVTDADIIRWINSAQAAINRSNRVVKGVATLPTVAGTQTYTFPAVQILSVDALQYNGKPLKYVSFTEAQDKILSEDPELTFKGSPIMWYEYGNDIFLYPIPDTVKDLKLYYIAYPAAVVLTTDVLKLPDSYFDAILEYVLAQAYEQDDDWQASQFKSTQHQNSLTVLAQDADGYQRGFYPTITVLDD